MTAQAGRRSCSLDGCERKHYGKGFCHKHYQRLRTHGDPRTRKVGEYAPGTTCGVTGCGKKIKARGYCDTHYQRLRAHGDPLTILTKRGMSEEERFWSDVTEGTAPEHAPELGACWLWTGDTVNEYGKFKSPRTSKKHMAHRWSYEHMIGPIPDGLQLDHLCRVKSCVNPYHLDPVTPSENTRRAREAQRATP